MCRRILVGVAAVLVACGTKTPGTAPPVPPGPPAYVDDPADDPPPRAFEDGPGGTRPYDSAGDFTVPTLAGAWSLSEHWSGFDSHVFLVRTGFSEYSRTLWESSPAALLAASPPGVHYFFLSDDPTARYDVQALAERFESALAARSAASAEHWRERLHFVDARASILEGWVGDVVRARPAAGFAIDRFQRLREVGMLAPVQGAPAMSYLANEAAHFDFEARREYVLSAREALVVPVVAHRRVEAEAFFDAELPGAADLARYDTLELDLAMTCTDGVDANCADWDAGVSLALCDRDAPDRCETELGRWITTYKRAGRWVTDASPMLALLGDGGRRRMRF